MQSKGSDSQEIAFVTGGGSGIGLATVEAVLERGRRAIAADVSNANLEKVQARLAHHGDRLRCELLDVTNEAQILQVVETIEAEFGPITGLVNSAGIARQCECLETSTELFRQVLEINLIGSFVVSREVGKRMAGRGRGAIVNISSVSGLRAGYGRVAYGASKAGLISMTQVMASELAQSGIRVNAIAPGAVETALAKELHGPEFRAAWARLCPQERYSEPAEIASVIVFLLDDTQSSFITGETICVDGGYLAGAVRS
jgi:NAD(P)-dependent dehydrogenase (short-subunit alcohol dehydrogenase family)